MAASAQATGFRKVEPSPAGLTAVRSIYERRRRRAAALNLEHLSKIDDVLGVLNSANDQEDILMIYV